MKNNLTDQPRKFIVGKDKDIQISDYGTIQLKPNDMMSFKTDLGKEYDVAAKEWGFYATPSLNSRLVKEGFKTALVKNAQSQYFVMVVENEHMMLFEQYLEKEENQVVEWLDERKE